MKEMVKGFVFKFRCAKCGNELYVSCEDQGIIDVESCQSCNGWANAMVSAARHVIEIEDSIKGDK